MKPAKQIGIVLPAYNEGSVIGKVLSDIPKSVKVDSKLFKITTIVVNDASTDNTQSIISKRKGVILINHILNSGAGAATRTGINYAKELECDYIITMDSDGQHSIKDAVNVVSEVIQNKADFAIGSRLINSSGMPWHRVLGNKLLSFFTFLLFGVFVADSQSGLKAMNGLAAEKIDYRSNSYAFCSEMIWKAHQAKLRIMEVPIEAIYTDYSLSKGQKNWDGIHLIGQLVKRRVIEILNG